MGDYFSQYSGVEIFFLICAVVGGFFVLIKFIMMFMGMDHDVSHDLDIGGHDLDVGGHDIDAQHTDSDVGFHILSLHGITSFLMMFGLVGLAMYRQSSFGIFISLIGAVVAGCITVWIIGKLFLMASKMKSSGTISIDSTVGAKGKVYMKIPEKGTGRVLVNVKNSLREYDASTNDGTALETGAAIRVVWVDGNLLVVERI
jgi:membrane protein implicated in regulation of membrane protease activity